MKIKVSYETCISTGLYGELEDKIKVFFAALGFDETGSGSGMRWRNIEFENKKEFCNGSSLYGNGETPFSPPPTIL